MFMENEVRKGMALLDVNVQDWRSKVNVTKLNQRDTLNCILGQLYGTFYDGLLALNVSYLFGHWHATDFGFDAPLPAMLQDYEELTKTWIALMSEPVPAVKREHVSTRREAIIA